MSPLYNVLFCRLFHYNFLLILEPHREPRGMTEMWGTTRVRQGAGHAEREEHRLGGEGIPGGTWWLAGLATRTEGMLSLLGFLGEC